RREGTAEGLDAGPHAPPAGLHCILDRRDERLVDDEIRERHRPPSGGLGRLRPAFPNGVRVDPWGCIHDEHAVKSLSKGGSTMRAAMRRANSRMTAGTGAKRVFDLVLAAVGLVLLSPPLLAIAPAGAVAAPGGCFF